MTNKNRFDQKKKCDQTSGFIVPELQLLDPKIKIIVQQNVIYCKVQGHGARSHTERNTEKKIVTDFSEGCVIPLKNFT